MKTFISYESSIKITAGKVKSNLDKFGFDCFLAHENIVPESKWPDELKKALESSSLFLPILTPEFKTSYYCQQETGFALCKGVTILPVMISQPPMGMIANLQAIKFNEFDIENSCWQIVIHVAKKPRTISKPILDSLIKWLGESESYDVANTRAEKVLNDFDFSDKQVLEIKDHIRNNSQINQTKNARDIIFDFMEKFRHLFDDDFIEWYDSDRASKMWLR
jgi:hypothetical protein